MLLIILERLTGMQHGKVVDLGQTAGFHVHNELVLLGNLLHKVGVSRCTAEIGGRFWLAACPGRRR